jgi:hypothetical protein
MKSLEVTIKGISPMLMHRYPEQPIDGFDKMTPAEQAQHAEYRTPNDQLYVPSIAMQRALVDAAAYSKGKGRASLLKVAAAAIYVSPIYLILKPQTYVVDSRPVVVPATRGRIMRHRPRLDEWEVTFHLEYDETLLSEVQVRKIVDDCGSRVGLLDFRPARKGPFGRFMVTQWNRD